MNCQKLVTVENGDNLEELRAHVYAPKDRKEKACNEMNEIIIFAFLMLRTDPSEPQSYFQSVRHSGCRHDETN